jgi:hypothetical protein
VPVLAWCPEPMPSVREEAASSDYVLTATVISQRLAPAIGGALKGWSYRLHPLRVFRGRGLTGRDVFTENSSGRFPLEVGKQYLLFATAEDQLEITNCGHSGLVAERQEAIAPLKGTGVARR